jgi:hypothetical protein
VDLEEDKDEEMEFQNTKRVLKAFCSHFDFDSSTDECRKELHIMYGGSWHITSRRVIKTMRRVVAASAPTPSAVPHHKWMETSISFDASDCPQEHCECQAAPAACLPDHRQHQVVPHPS